MSAQPKTVTESINLRYWQDGAYFKAWYPVCLSTDLVPGKIKGIDFLNSRIIAYRGPDGAAIVQTAFCPHLGADLSIGQLVEGEVRCAYHHWRFNTGGACTHVPSLGKALPTASIQNYPVVERLGLVWVFNGREAIGEVPSLIGVTEDDVVFRALDLGLHNTESWLPITNALDFEHVKSVHGIPVDADGVNFVIEPTSIAFDVATVFPGGKGKVFYHNTFSMRDILPFPPGNFAMPTSNSPRPNWYHEFAVLAVLKPADEAGMRVAQEVLDGLEGFLRKLNGEDAEILGTIRFRPRGQAKLVKADHSLAMLLDYFDRLPRGAPLD